MKSNSRVQYVTRHGHLKVIVDSNEVFPKDPGMGTPVMVEAHTEEGLATATIGCALGEGEVEFYKLTDEEIEWLEHQQSLADERLAPFWKE